MVATGVPCIVDAAGKAAVEKMLEEESPDIQGRSIGKFLVGLESR